MVSGKCKYSVWGEEAMWEAIMMEEERQESDCNVTERSRRSRLPENPSGRRTNQQWMCDSCSYFVGWPELPSAPLLWGEDTVDRFSFTGFSKGDILSFPVHSHPTIICVHLDSVWNWFWWIFFFFPFFLFLYFNKTVVCFHRKWKFDQQSGTWGAVAPTLTWDAWTLILPTSACWHISHWCITYLRRAFLNSLVTGYGHKCCRYNKSAKKNMLKV